jgi:hypothetical protein
MRDAPESLGTNHSRRIYEPVPGGYGLVQRVLLLSR